MSGGSWAGSFFALVFTLDLLKGLAPVLAAGAWIGFAPVDAWTYLCWLLVGLAAIMGHMFSLFLRFKGGKGVATSAGVLLGVFPYFTYPGLAAMAVFTAVFFSRRIVSLASIVAAAAFPLAYLAMALAWNWGPLGAQSPLLVFAFLVGGLIVYRHRGNIARLRAGTEQRVGRPRPGVPAGNGDKLHAGDGDGLGDSGGPSDTVRRSNLPPV